MDLNNKKKKRYQGQDQRSQNNANNFYQYFNNLEKS